MDYRRQGTDKEKKQEKEVMVVLDGRNLLSEMVHGL